MKNETELINDLINDTEANEKTSTSPLVETLQQNNEPIQGQETTETKENATSSVEFIGNTEANPKKTTQQTPKKGRGRPRKTESGNITQAVTTQQNGSANKTGAGVVSDTNPLNFDEFKTIQVNSTPTSAGVQPSQNEINAAKFITGAILLMVCDAIIPTALIKVLGMFDAKYKQLKTKNIKLSADQRKDLEPLADECVKAMTLNMHPTTAFFITMFILYGSNLMNTEI